jgi:hypothetical protein
VNVEDRQRSQALPSLPAFHITIALKLCLECLNVNWRKLPHRYLAKPWRDLARNNLAVADGSLVRDPALDIDCEPMLKVLPDAHLSRVNVGPLGLAAEQPR